MWSSLFRVVLACGFGQFWALYVGENAPRGASTGAGAEAELSEQGYQRVAAAHDDEEMKAFIRRVAAAQGQAVVDEGQLSGFAPHYSGTKATQNLAQMQAELQRMPWVRSMEAASASGVTALPMVADEEGSHEGAIAGSTTRPPISTLGVSTTFTTTTSSKTRYEEPVESAPVKGGWAEAQSKPLSTLFKLKPHLRHAGVKSHTQGINKTRLSLEDLENATILPDVDKMISDSVGGMLKDIAEKSAFAQAMAKKQQADLLEYLQHQRQRYESRIKARRAINVDVFHQNEKIQERIERAMSENRHLRYHGKWLRMKNSEMRHALGVMEPKFVEAANYVTRCKTDLEKELSEAVAAMERTVPPPSVQKFAEMIGSTPPHLQAAARVSLLHTGARAGDTADSEALAHIGFAADAASRPAATPSAIASRMGSILRGLDRSGHTAAMRMEAFFLATLEEEQTTHSKLMEQQAKWNQTLDSLAEIATELRSASSHGVELRNDLLARLGGVRVFANQVAIALASVIHNSTEIWGQIQEPPSTPHLTLELPSPSYITDETRLREVFASDMTGSAASAAGIAF